MKRSTMSASVLALAFVLAGCGERADTTATEGAAADSGVADKGAAASLGLGKGAGTVTAIDAAGGKITLDHGPIPELGWPAMKMAFKAAPAVTGSVAVGDEVEFEVRRSGMNSEVTAITKK